MWKPYQIIPPITKMVWVNSEGRMIAGIKFKCFKPALM